MKRYTPVCALLLTMAMLTSVAPLGSTANASSAPININFVKSPDPSTPNTWLGATSGDVTGNIKVVLTQAQTHGQTLHADLDFEVNGIAEDGSQVSFTARLSGVVNLGTGNIKLNGQVTGGWLTGSQAHVDAQVKDADFGTFCVLGLLRIKASPAG